MNTPQPQRDLTERLKRVDNIRKRKRIDEKNTSIQYTRDYSPTSILYDLQTFKPVNLFSTEEDKIELQFSMDDVETKTSD
jgi:hypothetical protein